MKNVKPTGYTTPEIEIILLDHSDIVTASLGGRPNDNGYERDENIDNW